MAELWLTLLEGFSSFLTPCVLPLLPVYLIYLAGDSAGSEGRAVIRKRFINTLGFVLGFTLLFMLLGALAGLLGRFLQRYQSWLRIGGGLVLILFGLQMLGVFRIGFLSQEKRMEVQTKDLHFFSSMLFGAAFSVGWSPCMGPFLGAALLKASTSGSVLEGMGLLFVYSVGLGIPFIVLSLLYEKLRGVLNFFKRHMQVIQRIAGGLLILVGLAMVFNLMGYYMRLFNW